MILQDGILGVGGRLSIIQASKHPAILAKNHQVSELILSEVHKEVGHSVIHVLSKLPLKYSILDLILVCFLQWMIAIHANKTCFWAILECNVRDREKDGDREIRVL